MLKFINFMAGFFGYKFVVDEREIVEPPEEIEADEGYDDIYDQSPRYRLVKITSLPKE